MLHSRQKYGAIPCFRDFAAERRKKESERIAAEEAREMRKALDAAVGIANPLGGSGGPGPGGGGSALVIRNLAK